MRCVLFTADAHRSEGKRFKCECRQKADSVCPTRTSGVEGCQRVETYTLDWITDAFQEHPNESETATFVFLLQFTCLRSVEKDGMRSARANQHEHPISRRLQFSSAAFPRAIDHRCYHRHSSSDFDMDCVLHGAG